MNKLVVEFEVPGEPVAKARARAGLTTSGHTVHYTPPKTAAYQQCVALCAASAFVGQMMERGPLNLELTFFLPIRESWSRKKKEDARNHLLPHITKPDLDNLVKSVKDALTGVIWSDDSQIVYVVASKHYSDHPRCFVSVQRA